MKIKEPKTIIEAIDDLEVFFESDMWYAKENEWKTEKDMIKYLRSHFDILRRQVRELTQKKKIVRGADDKNETHPLYKERGSK